MHGQNHIKFVKFCRCTSRGFTGQYKNSPIHPHPRLCMEVCGHIHS